MWTGAWFRERGCRARRIGCQFCLGSVDFCRELLIGRIELERSLPIDLSLAQIVQCLVGVANMFENDRVFRFQLFQGTEQLGQRLSILSGIAADLTERSDDSAIVGLQLERTPP